MAKKVKNKVKNDKKAAILENVLPQNILPVGERVEENKNIYISQSVYKEIHRFTRNKTTNESGGMLVGNVIEEFGKINVVISGFVEAKFCEATPTTLKFTHETWEYVHKEIDKRHKGKKIVGWIHTHPDFGIFLSEYDKFIHQNFFSEEYQIAYVVDPIQNIEGFYFWINEKIERCKGFYIYDRTGVKIKVDPDTEEEAEREERAFSWKNIVLAILSVAVVFLIFSNISTNNRLEKLENDYEKEFEQLVKEINYVFSDIEQKLKSHTESINEIRSALTEAGLLQQPDVNIKDEQDDIPDNSTDMNDENMTDADENQTDDMNSISEAPNTDVPQISEEGGTENE